MKVGVELVHRWHVRVSEEAERSFAHEQRSARVQVVEDVDVLVERRPVADLAPTNRC